MGKKDSNYQNNLSNGEFVFFINNYGMRIRVKDSWVYSFDTDYIYGNDFHPGDEYLKFNNIQNDIEGEWFSTDSDLYILHRYLKDNYWIEFRKLLSNGGHQSIVGGWYDYNPEMEFPYDFQVRFHSNEPGIEHPVNINNFDIDNSSYKIENDILINKFGGAYSRDAIDTIDNRTTSKVFDLNKMQFNLEDNRIANIQLSIKFLLFDDFYDFSIESSEAKLKDNELLSLYSIIQNHILQTPDLSFNRSGNKILLQKLNNFFNIYRDMNSESASIYPKNPIIEIIPQTFYITGSTIYSSKNKSENIKTTSELAAHDNDFLHLEDMRKKILDHPEITTNNDSNSEPSTIIKKENEYSKHQATAQILTNMPPTEAANALRASADSKELAKIFYFIQKPEQNALISELNRGTKRDRILAADILTALTKIEPLSGADNKQ